MIRTVGKPYLHFHLPPNFGVCAECGGWGIIKPLSRIGDKHSFSLECGHEPNGTLRQIASIYYGDRVRRAQKHIEDCLRKNAKSKI